MKQFYFPHDENACGDEKLLAVRANFGWEGIGVFWFILETMSRNDGRVIEGLIGGLSLGYGIKDEKWLKKLLDFCVEIELFKKKDSNYYSERMIENINMRRKFAVSGKKGAEIRWSDRGANRVSMGGLIAGEERREEKSKEKEKKKEKEKESFFSLYQTYPKKIGRAPALKSWLKLTDDEKLKAAAALSVQVGYWKAEKTELQYIPNFVTWLNQKRWEDELESKPSGLFETNKSFTI